MRLRVIDFETTGTDKDRASGKDVRVCEIGYTDVDGATMVVAHPVSAIVNCGIPMPPEARAIHHLCDEDISGGISPDMARAMLMEGMEPGDIFVAHRAAFERAFFPGDAFPWICTLQCAKHLWDHAAGFSNQALRYWLGIDAEFAWPEQAMPPHRAGPDSYVTAHILVKLMADKHPSSLIQLTSTPVLLKAVPFGKYEGRPWSEMDRGYLEWILDPARTNVEPDAIFTARYHLNQLTMAGTPFA